jgi:quercetin dioxygenase-like cupin family protein
MYQHIIATDSLPWQALDFSHVFMRIINQNERTGGMTVMTRLEPGAIIPAHRHTEADETVFVLSGDFVEADATYGVGSFFAAVAGTPHGPHTSRTGCIVLTTFSAKLDFQLV